ncbi:fructosamine kinase family protein [Actinomycetospora endophytica]|nr:fructosamine kinase family protein [Actinomycetospora endophytica]
MGPVTRCTLEDGTEVIAKRGDVAAEAAGLRWLAVDGGPGVPAVLGADESWLVSEAVGDGSAGRGAAEAFGRELAVLHAAGAPAFGSPPVHGPAEAWIGDAPMRNDPAPEGTRWIDWYVEARVMPYVRLAVDRGGMTSSQASQLEDGCARLAGVDLGPEEPPARLHGDLWTGNVLWGVPGAWIIDPAAHGGHRETDLAMLALFGCPQLDTVLAAYDEAAPLADGWRDRVGLHQLFPLLVHAALFGGGYASSACERISSS